MTSIATPSELIAALNDVAGDAPRPLVLHEPLFTGNEKDYVSSCIEDGWVSSVGAFVDRFEKDLAKACGAPYAVVTVNGTCALHAALAAHGIGIGDEVIIPSLTFVATANAVVHAGAVPHFVDVEEHSLGMCPDALEAYLDEHMVMRDGKCFNPATNRFIKAIMPVHIFGHPCQLEAIARIATVWGMILIEDATEALGSELDGKPIGSSYLSVFSFNGNKIITTGGGGAITMQDEATYQRLKHLTTTAKAPHQWAFYHDEVAFNYRMPNLNAALGCAQLEKLSEYVNAKRALAARYQEKVDKLSGVRILGEPAGSRSNYWLVTLIADAPPEGWLEQTLTQLHDARILARPIWQPLHTLPMYLQAPSAPLPNTESLAKRIINLPSSVKLGYPYV